MKRELIVAVGCIALAASFAAADARAQVSATQASPARTAPRASGAPHVAGPLDAGAVMPADHPAVPEETADGPRGGGDPPAEETEESNPHAGGRASASTGTADVPEDGAREDAAIPKGAIELQVSDPAGKPLAHTEATLGILYNSVAKGESRKRVTTTTDDAGIARFKDLDTGSGVAYRPMVLTNGATFDVTPFALGAQRGMRALLHVYPIANDIEQTLVVSQSMLYAEVKDDRIQIQQVFKIYNFGRNAWVPTDLVVKLPEGFTAFATQQGMTDVGVDAVPNQGVKLRGTFGPGEHAIEFKWQLPYSGEGEVKFDVGTSPHLAAARVIAPASKGMAVEVEGFEPTKTTSDGMGQRALVTEKQLRRDDPPLKSLAITIKGLPTEGPGKIIATFLALGGIVMGVVLGSRKAPPRDTKRERQQLLAALEGLELGHRDGSIGPKTYQRARRDLVDDIARTFAADPETIATKSPRKKGL